MLLQSLFKKIYMWKFPFYLQGVRWTPSKMIHRLGKEINNTDSVYYWAYKVSFASFKINR